ncbi:type II secretion system major pseudopilin GspG [Treponema zioleckii]|uniref:type II secretion system major pseudopilin GspG n=1 Tax=Treponema zioleckii TaxID=331680 RepID=UPI00168AD448|nr:type II secretion system major pseudopilin GspG [Treponema zioleckii]
MKKIILRAKKIFESASLNHARRLKAQGVSDGKNAGFTFVETLAVLVVTGLLASQVGIATNSLIQRAKVSSAKNQIEMFKVALQSYYIDCGRFPTGEQGLSALWEKPSMYPLPETWNGPYVEKKIPLDPWGNPYIYFSADGVALSLAGTSAPEGLPYAIVSYGADGVSGGEGAERDVVSWE